MASSSNLEVDLDQAFQTSIDTQIDTLLKIARDNWDVKAKDAKQHLEEIRKYQELIQKHQREVKACISSAEEAETKVRDRLIATYGADRVLPRWEAQGDLAPRDLRQTLHDIDAARPLDPSEASPPEPVLQQARTPDSSNSSPGSPQDRGAARSPVKNGPSKRSAVTTPAADSEPPAKRTRRSLGNFTSKLNAEPEASDGRTIPFWQIDGRHWAFKFPSAGQGYFVLLCNKNPEISHRFQVDPLAGKRAIRHFASKDAKCHRDVEGLPDYLTEAELVQRYGYKVDEMSEQECIDSNQRIADERVSTISKGQSKKATGEPGRQTATDLPMTRSSRPYGKPEIQPIRRPPSGLIEASKWYNFTVDEPTPVRSDLQ